MTIGACPFELLKERFYRTLPVSLPIAEDQVRQLGFRMLSTERQRYERLMAEARGRLGDAYDVEHGSGATHGTGWAVKENEEAITGRLHFASVKALDVGAYSLVVLGQQ